MSSPTAWLERGLKFAQGLIPNREAETRAVPEGLRVYAVGDIHGCLAQLNALLDRIAQDRRSCRARVRYVFLGDFVDRGPDSRGVIERLLDIGTHEDASFIRGNHDQTLLDFLDDPKLYREWRDYGGRETLASYGVPPPRFDDEKAFVAARDALRAALPPSHLAFLAGLPYAIEIGDYFFTHAGIRPGVALQRQQPYDLMWIRDEFLYSGSDHGKIVVHGHTPVERPQARSNRIAVDTGVYATGLLAAVVLEGTTCRFLTVGPD